ncbi:MAG: S-adenosylmethionine:tRNA ribosyltransferase-isomerase [Patescibacteria group bacterium]|nr:S-adenosylmethionine:tRNA ribosyltransferase-isomerase [Patescibacteria group bacterium]
MKISDFNYDLPESYIAQEPPEVRGSSRLLVLDKSSGQIQDNNYSDITNYLNKGVVLVLNDTKVIKARLFATKQNGAKRELILIEKHGKNDNWHTHKVLYRGKLSKGDVLKVNKHTLNVEQILGEGIALIISNQDLLKIAQEYGHVPLPPYINRPDDIADNKRYQTIWAKEQGSVAAPTASLNMTQDTLAKLQNKGVFIVYATLHVGLGTFLPVRTDKVEDHTMHKEYFEVPKSTVQAIQNAKQNGNKIIALGTTITRTLEYCHKEILSKTAQDLQGEADIFMYPGYKFKVIDSLITNFHAPNSTVLLLAAAFGGWDNLKNAYEHAKKQNYRFLSYGDSMFIY